MQMKQCASGHFYNSIRHSECPYCSGESDLQSSFPLNPPSVTMRLDGEPARKSSRDMHTIAVIEQETGSDPVVGWLVCMNGELRGRDFRLHSDNNFIGRDPRMDVCIPNDLTVSRNNHALISFDNETEKFYLSIAEGRSIIRLNGQPVLSSAELTAYDEIAIGSTKLMFFPLCTDKFTWKKKDNSETEGGGIEK